jgi:hypothetical protein
MASFNTIPANNHTALHLATLNCHHLSPECPIVATVYGYQPSLAANAFFTGLFAVCAVAQIFLGFYSKAWMYCRFVALACIIETVGKKSATSQLMIRIFADLLCFNTGYSGRLMLWSNPWSSIGFKIQISMLIIGPAFLAAAVYITLKDVIRRLTPEDGDLSFCSPLKPVVYTPLFITCDAVCGLLQAAGGAVAAAAGTRTAELNMGGHIMLAGVVAQVAVSLSFIFLVSIYMVRLYRQRQSLAMESLELMGSAKFRIFVASLITAFWAVFVRCIFRIAEM